jgi:ethanolamine utilization protein EutQ (cupin superfamily)
MPSPVIAGVNVVEIPGLTIKEYHGGVSTKNAELSAVHEVVTEPSVAPWRCPEFDEYILVTRGEAHVESGADGKTRLVVRAGCGVYLPKGCRVRVAFPGPAEVVAICLPAFSPMTEHAGVEGTSTAVPHKTDSTPELFQSVDVVKAPTLTITEYFGNVASKDASLSACVAKIDEPCSDAWERPNFAKWVLVLSGTLHLEHTEGNTVVPAGSGVFLAANERVKWVWPEACTYVPICMPAFTPDGCGREPEEGSIKEANPETMIELHKLHTSTELHTSTKGAK